MESVKTTQPNFSYIRENISITDNSYYKMGGIARYFATPKNLKEVQQTLFFCKEQLLPCAILGSGSNSVYADGEFTGLVLSLEKLNAWHWESTEYLYVEAGVTNTEIAEICAAANRAGASWMYRMPGQIGATVRMNARCYGGEVSQIAQEIITINQNAQLITYKSKEIFQGYKKTLLMTSPHVVVGVRLYFPKVLSAEKLIQHMHECEADRHNKKHFYLPSCGSTFKNNYVVGKPSGKIFEELGLKGKQIGEAAVSEFHANFVWNKRHAKTDDMLKLAAFMRAEAMRVLNVELELEVQPVGCFAPDLFVRCGMENLGLYFEDKLPATDKQNKWVGLFNHPVFEENKSFSFPQTLFSSPFFEYRQTPLSGVLPIIVNLVQLQAMKEAQKSPQTPFLKWETCCSDVVDKLFSLLPTNTSSYNDYKEHFVDNLWHYSVSEIFFAKADNPTSYLEFEVNPYKDWLALKFSGIRKRSKDTFKPSVQIFSNNHNGAVKSETSPTFGMIFTYADLHYIFGKSQSILMQCALSLGNKKYLLAPYWKKEENKNENPDFHQPHRFWKVNLF